MQAGRELDALVAEKVMGWNLLCCNHGVDGSHSCWFDTDGKRLHPKVHLKGWDTDSDEDGFSPSTSIIDAWEVVERAGLVVGKTDEGEWMAVHSTLDREFEYWFDAEEGVVASTAPLAICLAALRAVGVEVPE
jgi:hypothetical protein